MTKSRAAGYWISSRARRMSLEEMLRCQGMEPGCFKQAVGFNKRGEGGEGRGGGAFFCALLLFLVWFAFCLFVCLFVCFSPLLAGPFLVVFVLWLLFCLFVCFCL